MAPANSTTKLAIATRCIPPRGRVNQYSTANSGAVPSTRAAKALLSRENFGCTVTTVGVAVRVMGSGYVAVFDRLVDRAACAHPLEQFGVSGEQRAVDPGGAVGPPRGGIRAEDHDRKLL